MSMARRRTQTTPHLARVERLSPALALLVAAAVVCGCGKKEHPAEVVRAAPDEPTTELTSAPPAPVPQVPPRQ